MLELMADFDDYHLTIHAGSGLDIPPFDLDLRFDPAKAQRRRD